ncbi:MAG: hypothetical protein ACI4XJ_05925 [Eubacteriales bacterium]
MTRKRYIKLLMSKGYSRNSAREEADLIVAYNNRISNINKVNKIIKNRDRAPYLSYDFDYYVNGLSRTNG